MKSFGEVRMPRTVLVGKGSFEAVGEAAARLGKKALVVSDPVMERLGYVNTCAKRLQESGLEWAAFTGVDTEPTDVHVAEAMNVFHKEGCDVIVALGGGSCMDAAKAVSLLAANSGQLRDYVGGQKPVEQPPIPLIAIPTTAGTGSEVTSVTVITDTAEDVKMMVKHPALVPETAIVDPILTVTSPPNVTAATGIDALSHAVEAYLSRLAHPFTDTLALSAAGLMMRNIRRAWQHGDDLDAREQMMLGSLQAGIAFSNASVCLVHGMSRPIGALFHVPHGLSNAMLLPTVLEYTREAAVARLAELGRVFRPDLSLESDEAWADVTIQEIQSLCRDLQIPSMRSWGIDRERYEQLLPKMASDAIASGSPGNHPRVPAHHEIVELYRRAYDHD